MEFLRKTSIGAVDKKKGQKMRKKLPSSLLGSARRSGLRERRGRVGERHERERERQEEG